MLNSEKIGGHTITKGYFSGKYVLRVWGMTGETLHSSTHDLPEHARAELDSFRASRPDLEQVINNLPQISIADGMASRTGLPTPTEPAE
jgi:hypothetical protein